VLLGERRELEAGLRIFIRRGQDAVAETVAALNAGSELFLHELRALG